jgi:predicted nucleic acid-binding protein
VKSVIVDSGFLIGLFDETDPLHTRCRDGIREILTADRRDFAVYRISGRSRFIDVLAD